MLIRYAGTLYPPYALVCGPHKSGGNPTLDVSARPQVGLLPICYEVDGYPFQITRGLHIQYPINGGEEWGENDENDGRRTTGISFSLP